MTGNSTKVDLQWLKGRHRSARLTDWVFNKCLDSIQCQGINKDPEEQPTNTQQSSECQIARLLEINFVVQEYIGFLTKHNILIHLFIYAIWLVVATLINYFFLSQESNQCTD